MHRAALILCSLSSLLHLLPALPMREAAASSTTVRPEDEELFHQFLSGSLEMEVEVDALEEDGSSSNKRLGRRETMVGLRHLHCSKAAGETWSAAGGGGGGGGGGTGVAPFPESVLYRVTVTTASTEPPWKVFPLWHLMVFMRRFYSCCKFGYPCRTIKGYQGRLLGHDDREMEFFLRPEYLFVNILRAQLHLNIANPDRVVLEAEIRVKMQGTTVITRARNIVWHTRSESELAFDALFLFKLMKEAHLQAGGGTTQFQLILRCSRHNRPLSCRDHGVTVLRAPFMAIGYI